MLTAVTVMVFWPRQSSARADEPAPTPAQAHTTYLADCAICHGADARGTENGPSLVQYGRAGVDYAISSGRMPLPPNEPNKDPARSKPRYSKPMIAALVEYVGGLLGGRGPDIPTVDPAKGSLSTGGELFRLQCAACHSWSGVGGALLHREAPTTHPATATQIGEAIRVGPGNMPKFGEAAVSQRDLNSLVAYVRYLRDPRDRGGEDLWHLGPIAEGLIAWIAGIGLLLLAVRWIGERL